MANRRNPSGENVTIHPGGGDAPTLGFDTIIDKQTRIHLKNVYSSFASAAFVAAIGAHMHNKGIFQGGFLSFLLSFLLIILIAVTHDPSGRNSGVRFMYLLAFAFFDGVSTGPLIERAWAIRPSLVISAFLYTCIIFTCFSCAAITAPEGKYLMIGAPLMAMLCCLMFAALLNIFFKSQTLGLITLVLMILLICGYILYDTQLIMVKFHEGDKDYIWHALVLLIDFICLFRDILTYLTVTDDGRRR